MTILILALHGRFEHVQTSLLHRHPLPTLDDVVTELLSKKLGFESNLIIQMWFLQSTILNLESHQMSAHTVRFIFLVGLISKPITRFLL